MKRIEVTGPSPHDGMRMEVPAEVVALVVITNRDGEYVATWSRSRRGDVDDQRCANALHQLLVESGWVSDDPGRPA